MPEIAYTPNGQAIRNARVVPPATIITTGGNAVQAIRVVSDTGAYTAEGYQIQALRLVDAAGLPVGTLTPITTQPEDMYTPDGYPIRHVRIVTDLHYTGDGHAVTPVRFYGADGAVVPPSLVLDFTTGTLPAAMTFTRASTAWGFNARNGNLLQNPWITGSVAPSTYPTGWLRGGSAGGLTGTILGTGTESGRRYIDIRYNGTTTGSTTFTVEQAPRTNGVAGALGQTFTYSAWFSRVAGSWNGITATATTVSGYTSAGAVAGNAVQNITIGGTAEKFTQTYTLTDPAAAFVVPTIRFAYSLGVDVDFTIRISEPVLTSADVPAAAVLVPHDTDMPRFVYDPATLANLGLLVEGARTNSLRNSMCTGAVVGSPGTAPTNWVLAGGPVNGISREIVGTGVEDGIDYVDVRFFGTASPAVTFTMSFDSATAVAALTGQVWSYSFYTKLVAGALTGVTPGSNIIERDAGGASIAGTSLTTSHTLTTAALRTQRQSLTRTLMGGGTTAFVLNGATVLVSSGVTTDVTIRFGLPQLELGDGPTSPVRTSTVAVIRQHEFATITDPRILTDRCYVLRGRTPSFLPIGSGPTQIPIHVDDGGNTNRNYMQRIAGGAFVVGCAPGVSAITVGSPADGSDIAVAARYATNNFAASLNGAAVLTDAVGTEPTGLTTGRLGRAASGSLHHWNSTIRSIETRATATDVELVALSAPDAAMLASNYAAAVVANGGTMSPARHAVIAQFIAAEKAAGTWDLTDDYWPLWGENAAQALTSLKQRRLCVAVAAPGFTVDRGYTFDGATNYINTGFSCLSHAVAMTGTNVRSAIYERTNVSANVNSLGGFDTTSLGIGLRPRSGAQVSIYVNSAFVGFSPLPVSDSRGYTVGSRNGPGVAESICYKNGVALPNLSSTTFDTNLVSQPIYIGCRNLAGTADLFRVCSVGFVSVGASLTPAQEVAHYANVQAWATAIGANV